MRTKEKQKIYNKQYWKKNKIKESERCKKYKKTFFGKMTNLLNSIKQRCTNIKQDNYSRYGGKGIKCFLTKEDLFHLAMRDEYNKLKKPSIDRKDSNKNYTLENCRFIELTKNVKIAHKNKKYSKRV